MLELASRAVAASVLGEERLARFRFEAVVALFVDQFVAPVGELALHSVAAEVVKLELLAKFSLIFGGVWIKKITYLFQGFFMADLGLVFISSGRPGIFFERVAI